MRVLSIEGHMNSSVETALTSRFDAALQQQGLFADTMGTLADGEEALRSFSYAALLVDQHLPDGDGVVWLRRRRSAGMVLPVLVMIPGGRYASDARIAALESGADDCVTLAETTPRELAARLRALLRRAPALATDVLRFGDLALDVGSRSVECDGLPFSCPRRELALLEILLRRAGRIVPRSTLEVELYGLSGEVCSNSLDVRVSRLRRTLQECGSTVGIRAIRGVGYTLAIEAQGAGASRRVGIAA